ASRAETSALATLRGLSPPPRYRQPMAALVKAIGNEAAVFEALAKAGRSNNRGAYASAVRRMSAASRGLSGASRRVATYQLGVPEFGVLRLAGPPARQLAPAVT